MEDKMRQLICSLAKYSRSEVLSLDEAAQKIGVSGKYLLELIRRGRIKAFKIGDDWLIEANWLEDFREEIKNGLNSEIAERFQLTDHGHQTWTKKISAAKRWRLPFNFLGFLKTATASVVLAFGAIFISALLVQSVYGQRINDEKLTSLIRKLIGRQSFGQVAGEYSVRSGLR